MKEFQILLRMEGDSFVQFPSPTDVYTKKGERLQIDFFPNKEMSYNYNGEYVVTDTRLRFTDEDIFREIDLVEV